MKCPSKGILGDSSNPNTTAQNMLVARLTFLLALCVVRRVYFIVEQPASSIMFSHPLLSRFLEEVQHSIAVVQLGAFSLECPKSIHLYGNAPWMSALNRTMTPTERAAMKRIINDSYCQEVCHVPQRTACFAVTQQSANLFFKFVGPNDFGCAGGGERGREPRHIAYQITITHLGIYEP